MLDLGVRWFFIVVAVLSILTLAFLLASASLS
jgi:hypothetical protein